MFKARELYQLNHFPWLLHQFYKCNWEFMNRSPRQENKLHISRYNHRTGQDSIKLVGARLRNNLPVAIQNSKSINIAKRKARSLKIGINEY